MPRRPPREYPSRICPRLQRPLRSSPHPRCQPPPSTTNPAHIRSRSSSQPMPLRTRRSCPPSSPVWPASSFISSAPPSAIVPRARKRRTKIPAAPPDSVSLPPTNRSRPPTSPSSAPLNRRAPSRAAARAAPRSPGIALLSPTSLLRPAPPGNQTRPATKPDPDAEDDDTPRHSSRLFG